MKLKYPMNGALPSTEHARDRLLAKTFKYRAGGKRTRPVSDEDFALLYAYGEFPIKVSWRRRLTLQNSPGYRTIVRRDRKARR